LGFINARIIQDAQSIIKPVITFLISFFHWSKVVELFQLLAIITPPVIIIMREVMSMSERAIFIKAFIKTLDFGRAEFRGIFFPALCQPALL
jgi:hypothetical protein